MIVWFASSRVTTYLLVIINSDIILLLFQICDANLTILHADASFGGASHDSYVWNNSPVKNIVEGLTNERCWLLGMYINYSVSVI